MLTGGAGADRLTGGSGADQFVYTCLRIRPRGEDLITDFIRAQGDRISLSAIDANSDAGGNQAFAFIGAAAFSQVAGQLATKLRRQHDRLGDVNGDGLADLQIQLRAS